MSDLFVNFSNLSHYLFGINLNGKAERSDRRFFMVDHSNPQILVLFIENKTDYYSEIPLTFSVNEQVLNVANSLDRQTNVTINGNTILTGLSEEPHQIDVFANY